MSIQERRSLRSRRPGDPRMRSVPAGAASVPVAAAGQQVEVTPCPHGPLLVRGADSVRDPDGVAHPVTRPVVAVCACEKSQRMPWCDGTHKVIPRS